MENYLISPVFEAKIFKRWCTVVFDLLIFPINLTYV